MQTSARILVVLFFFLLGLGAALVAQERSRQGGPPGSFQGQATQGEQPQQTSQQGGQPPWGGGAPGAPQPARSGPGGGPPGGGANATDRNTRMIAALRSMDVNQTGVLNPNDIPENRRGFVNAVATQFGVDPNRPINLADLERRAAAAATQSNATAQPRANLQPGSGPTSSGNNRSESGGSGRSSTPVVEPLVPPFGEKKTVETPVIGFGQRSATPVSIATRTSVASNRQPQPQQATPTILKQSTAYDRLLPSVRNNPVLDWFFSYDTDKDTQLTMQEYVNGRGRVWTPEIAAEFQSLDKNGDGLATIDEVLAFLKEVDDWRVTQAAQMTEPNRMPGAPPMVQPQSDSQSASQGRVTGTRTQAPANSSASPWESRGGNSQSSGNTASGNTSFSRGGQGGNTGRSTQQRGSTRGGGGR